MKFRTGYVSNSSSTSFCLFGKFFTKESLFEVLLTQVERDENNNDKWEMRDCLEDKLYDLKGDVEFLVGSEDENTIVGIAPMKMKEQETLAEFKARATESINEALGTSLTTENFSWELGEIC